jgi:hypothetical protein
MLVMPRSGSADRTKKLLSKKAAQSRQEVSKSVVETKDKSKVKIEKFKQRRSDPLCSGLGLRFEEGG